MRQVLAMAVPSGDAFVKALQSGTVTLLVGRDKEQITISKALLTMQSKTLSKFVEKGGGKLLDSSVSWFDEY